MEGGIEWVARQSELSQCGDIEGTVLGGDDAGLDRLPWGTGLSVDEVHDSTGA